MTQAARLRHRVTLQEAASAADQYGQPVETWAAVATLWAAVEPLRGREFYQAQQVNADLTHKVTIRYRAGVSEKQRILYGSRILEIASPPIDREERHIDLELLCVEKHPG